MSGSAAVGIIALGSLHVVFMLWFAVWWAERSPAHDEDGGYPDDDEEG